MRRIFCMLALGLYFINLTGCISKEKYALPVSEQIELEIPEEAQAELLETESQESINPIAERVLNFENNYIHDEQAVLSESEFEFYYNFLNTLHDSHAINATVVITNHLDGNIPADFAKSYYQALFGEEETNGFLLLINNDSFQDSYYLSGSCQELISEQELYALILKATPCLVEERYADALEILLSFVNLND